MTFGSVCSGIEAASVAWSPLGWRAAWLSEIEPFCCALLKHHYPAVPNLGDMQGIGKDSDDIDVLVGGTPCQSFSVAGLRKGLDDPRGNLALVFLRIADRKRPRWVVWENVPGVLSSGGGRDFGSFLGGLGQLGYGFAYRVLDAQYVRVESHARAVPQRRRRVFVVGYLGDWRRAGAVLLERESLRGDSPPRRTAGEGTAGTLAARTSAGGGLGTDFDLGGGLVPEVSCAMKARDSKGPSSDGDGDGLPLIPVAHSLRAEGHDASEDGTGRGVPLVAIPMMANGACGSNGAGIGRPGDPAMSLDSSRQAVAYGISPDCLDRSGEGAGGSAAERSGLGVEAELAYSIRAKRAGAVAFQTRIARNGRGQPKDVADALTSCEGGTHADSKPHVAGEMGVRRLTPRECERLQAFPDDYTLIPYRGKPAADGPRYRALGNSIACNVLNWIGQRIEMADAIR